MKSVIKWAGGKKSIIKEITAIINMFDLKNAVYFEPFVGGGSVFMSLMPNSIVINDMNEELINFYQQIRNKPEELILSLEKHKKAHSTDYFYKIRSIDRSDEYCKLSDIEKASRFAYLNRTCYNGLYRVNARNQFNTPIGRVENRELVFVDEIRMLHQYLISSEVVIYNVDFEEATKTAKNGDVIYFDPPYDYEKDGFDRYTPGKFGKADTLRLRNLCNELRKRGCHVIVSNNDTTYIRELYFDWNIVEIIAPRYINCKREREKVKEVIIYA